MAKKKLPFPDPADGTIFYEGWWAYACLAFEPLTVGHTIVAWKKPVKDLENLPMIKRLYLWWMVSRARTALFKHFSPANILVVYHNEGGGGRKYERHVHVNLIPRHRHDNRMPPEIYAAKPFPLGLEPIPHLKKLMSR